MGWRQNGQESRHGRELSDEPQGLQYVRPPGEADGSPADWGSYFCFSGRQRLKDSVADIENRAMEDQVALVDRRSSWPPGRMENRYSLDAGSSNSVEQTPRRCVHCWPLWENCIHQEVRF